MRPESDSDPKLSVVVPAYNEEDRLGKTLEEMISYLDSRGTSYEVFVVDDGSGDATKHLVEKLHQEHPCVDVLSYPENHGKGYAVRLGMMSARGERVLFADADGSTPFAEIARLEAALDKGADIAIGSRAIAAKDITLNTVWYRKLPGRIFAGIVNFLILPGVADTQCGFKLFSGKAAKAIFAKQRSHGFSFDVEVLFLARRAGFRIVEVPINWTNMPGSKVSLFRDSLPMILDVVKFRILAFFGAYEKNAVSSRVSTP